MFGKVNSAFLQGMEAVRVVCEVDVSDGIPNCNLVGFLASEVREAQDRVRIALKNLDLNLPPKRITINLSPGDIRKEGTGFDLAIAAAILDAFGAVLPDMTENTLFIGELGLDGRVKSVPGVLTLTAWAKEHGYQTMFLPEENKREASVIKGIRIVGIRTLREAVEILQGNREIPENTDSELSDGQVSLNFYDVDFSEVNGQPVLRRAAEVAAAGMHNLLMIGPAGSGKTMVARRMPTILPDLGIEESIEISKIYSISHLLNEKEPLVRNRPFRAPHYTVSAPALTGGGSRPKPGEISLATGGILFLDEVAEMSEKTLEVLRQPMEERKVNIARVYGNYTYPARFQLVAAMNPCKCGHYPDLSKCSCTAGQIRKYLSKISRPLLDRIDICVETAAISFDEVNGIGKNEDSASIRKRVEEARKIQEKRFSGTHVRCNSEMTGAMVRRYCQLNNEETEFMRQMFGNLDLSARMYDKVLKVARTVSDLAKQEEIDHKALCEAISYVRVRSLYWRN